MKKISIVITILAILFLAGCYAQTTTEVTEQKTTVSQIPVDAETVEIRNFQFSPREVVINVGGSVTWIQRDTAEHTVSIAGDESDLLKKDDKWTKMFAEPGEYPYSCGIHPTMRGKVIVK